MLKRGKRGCCFPQSAVSRVRYIINKLKDQKLSGINASPRDFSHILGHSDQITVYLS